MKGYKKVKSKDAGIQDRLRHKNVFCISNKWCKWAKCYMNRSKRRREKQDNCMKYNEE